MLVSVVALGLGTGLSYVLIFGAFGLPAMGVKGAALGTCLARLLECAVLIAITYRWRLPVAFYLPDIRRLTGPFVRRYLTTALPVVANESAWSFGITIYSVVYAHIGTQAIAAYNITGTIENLVTVIFMGISSASAIMIGNQIGAGEEHKAYQYARRSLVLGVVLGALMGALLIVFAGPIISYYKIGPEASENAINLLIVLGCALWVRVSNMTLIVGILRSGGDTRFSLVLDVGTVWLVGIPMALLGAFVFHLPVYWVFAMVMADDLTKAIGGLYRFLSRKWINNLVVN
jgi:Na+-driven multidrug efflux pump